VIGHDHAVVAAEWADHVPVQVAPCGLAVKAENRLAIAGAFVDVVLHEAVPVEGVWGKRKGSVERFVEWNHVGLLSLLVLVQVVGAGMGLLSGQPISLGPLSPR
jgi:hypothetical protein